jgi:hypothetical protein
MEIHDGQELSYADCDKFGVICISDDTATASRRAAEHREARPGHNTYIEQLGFTAGRK